MSGMFDRPVGQRLESSDILQLYQGQSLLIYVRYEPYESSDVLAWFKKCPFWERGFLNKTS